ncbi:17981_t:CDS:1, partial [Racocetra persica]
KINRLNIISQETHNGLDIANYSKNMTLDIEASKDINFENDAVIVDGENMNFDINNDKNIGFAFDDSDNINYAPDNENTSIVNSDSINPTIDSSNKDTSVNHSKSTSKWNRQHISIVWEFFSEEKNKDKEVVVIVCNICKKK